MKALLAIIAILGAAMVVPGCATNPVSGQSELVLMSKEEELALGRQLSKTLPEQYGGIYNDPVLAAYVTAIGEKIAAISHRPELIYHFTILDSPVVNAFALPGGYVYITRGMLAYLNSESELAGVLGHEIGHVTARHGVGQHTRSTLLSLLAEVAVLATNAGSGWRDAAGLVNTAIVRGYGRQAELEADRLGAQYIARVGYRPQKMLDLLAVLKAQEEYEKQRAKEEDRAPVVYHGVFSTHPKNEERLQEIVHESEKLTSAEAIAEDPEAFLQRMSGIVYGPAAKEGVVRGAKFYHGPLNVTLSYPQGWRIENRPGSLIARTRDNGALIAVSLRDRNRRESARKHLERTFRGRLTQAAPLRGALEGHTALARMNTPYGRRPARVAVVFKDKQAYEFLAAAEDAERFAYYDPDFLTTMKSMRALAPGERDLVKPRVIHLVRVAQGQTIDYFAARSALGHHAAEQIRLLNGLYPDGEPQPGQLLKIVR